jgi:hypothetical protein
LEKVTLEQWNLIAEDAHRYCFGDYRPKEMNTFDFALVVRNESQICAYSTCLEVDKESIYMQHGGAFPNIEKVVYTLRAYELMLGALRAKYKMATTRILNKNIPMLKLAFRGGFIVNGIDMNEGNVFLNLVNKFEQ